MPGLGGSIVAWESNGDPKQGFSGFRGPIGGKGCAWNPSCGGNVGDIHQDGMESVKLSHSFLLSPPLDDVYDDGPQRHPTSSHCST